MIDFNMIYISDLYWMGTQAHRNTRTMAIVRDKAQPKENGGLRANRCPKAVITPGYKTHEIDTAPGYRLKYSDGFYNMQGKGIWDS